MSLDKEEDKWSPGSYQKRCCRCKRWFIGIKTALECATCAPDVDVSERADHKKLCVAPGLYVWGNQAARNVVQKLVLAENKRTVVKPIELYLDDMEPIMTRETKYRAYGHLPEQPYQMFYDVDLRSFHGVLMPYHSETGDCICDHTLMQFSI